MPLTIKTATKAHVSVIVSNPNVDNPGSPIKIYSTKTTGSLRSQAPIPGQDEINKITEQIPENARYSVNTSQTGRPPAESFSYFPPPPELRHWPVNRMCQGNPRIPEPPLD